MNRIIFSLLLIISSLSLYGQEEWKLEKEKNGIQVFTRTRQGYEIKEFKSTVEIFASKESILKTVLNADTFEEWMKDIKNPKILREMEDNQVLTYYQVEVPWPMQNRDAIGDMRLTETSEGYRVDISVIPDYLPEYPKLVRMHDALGFWLIEPHTSESCQVTYQFVADPEGNVPSWIANLFIIDGPYQTLLNLKNRLE